MNQSLFVQYEVAKEQGNKRLAASLIASFVETFATNEEREEWTRWYFSNRPLVHAIRHELFEQVIFPVLLAGYQRSDPWCIEMLERCAQSLYRSEHLWVQIGHQTGMQLAERLLALKPDDRQTQARVLAHLIEWFRYSEHEWPAGILYGNDGATALQCDEVLLEVRRARALDEACVHTPFLNQFEAKVQQYIQRLEAGNRSSDH
jgi:hypothetical protein